MSAMAGMANWRTSWDLKPLFKGDDDAQIGKEREEVKQQSYQFINKWKDRDDYLTDPGILKQALDEYEQWARNYAQSGKEGYYFSLRSSQDQTNAKIKAKVNQVTDFSTKIQNDIQFFELRLAKVSQDQQQVFLQDERLKDYCHWLERLYAEAKYLLSEPEEKILNLKSVTAFANWVKMNEEFLSKEERMALTEEGKRAKKSFSEILKLMNSQQKPVRDAAAKAFNQILEKRVEVSETEINSVLYDKKINDELRNMPRPDLGRHLADDIDTEIVDTLVTKVTDRFDIARRYYQLKARLFGIKQLQYHERNVPYGKLDRRYEFGEAAELVNQVFSLLDPQFGELFKKYLENGQIDVYPQKSKTGGAYCAHNLVIHPTYILLNFVGQVSDVLTLAHEAGHGMNNELMKANQHALNFGTPKSTAEVASTFMEDFVLQELAKQADDELKLALMMMKLNDDVSTIFRQVAFYRFEQELHQAFRQKGYLSKEEIGQMFQQHMAAYMGEAVEQSPGSENWWTYVSHFRMFFYVYSYASGLLISKALQNSVKKDSKFISQVKEFLGAGTSDAPKNVFRRLGIDISNPEFWQQGLAEVEGLLAETEQLAGKLGKI